MDKVKVTVQDVRVRLEELVDLKYKEFHGSLLPGISNICGVRLPMLRTMAKKIAKQDWQEWFFQADDLYYEETMLRGLVISYAGLDVGKRMELLRIFVPAINNWAVCDCVCNTIKDAKKYQKEYWDFLKAYISSDAEYEVRFAVVMLLSHFVNDTYLEAALKCLQEVHQEGYYAKMSVAWAVSVFFAFYPEEMLVFLQGEHGLDEFTYKKSLQKILESCRVGSEMKRIIREMRQRG